MLKSLVLVLALSTLAEAADIIGFSAAYDPSNWVFTNDVFGNSQVDWTGAPDDVTVYRNNAYTVPLLPPETDLTITAPFTGTVSFDYSFGAGDPDFGVNHNQFGLIENGAHVLLFDSVDDGAGTNPLFVSTSFQVTAGETFGFYMSTDQNDGAGGQSFTIDDFDATGDVPEPASLTLLAGAIGLLLLRLKSAERPR